MLVHLISSTQDLEESVPFLRAIVKALHDQGAVQACSWIEPALHIQATNKKVFESLNWDLVVQENLAAIKRTDVVVVEATNYSFSQGFQIAAALEHKKPILVVARTSFKSRIISGLKNNLVTLKSYKTQDELEKIVRTFLRANTIATKDLRFNFFIDRRVHHYLQEQSEESGKNKSEIVRDIIQRKIRQKDRYGE